jgi:hypothetical protein
MKYLLLIALVACGKNNGQGPRPELQLLTEGKVSAGVMKMNFLVQRSNGVGVSPAKILKHPEARIRLEIVPKHTQRDFVETTETKTYTRKKPQSSSVTTIVCSLNHRGVAREYEVLPQSTEFLRSLVLVGNGVQFTESAVVRFEEKVRSGVVHWTIELDIPASEVSIGLADKSAASFNHTGLFHTSCSHSDYVQRHPVSTVPTHSEGKFELAMEAYVDMLE